jgi:LuxR family maltose regulon positive regulatory protein
VADATIDPGIVLKITPPKLRRSLLVRERLRGIRSEDVAVFLVQAPAGYGKTSLLAQWRLDWLQSGAIVGWLGMSAGDRPGEVVGAIVESLRRAAGAHKRALGPFRSSGEPIAELTALLAAVAEGATPTVLIFDDCERISDSAVLEVIEYLLHNLPPNLQIAAGSRKAIPVRAVDLIAHGNLRSVTVAELRFDHSEMASLLSARLGPRADTELCARLHRITEGWPLGVQLAAAALERASDWDRALAAFSTSREDTTRQLLEGMIAALPPPQLALITACALLDALHPSLCEAVTCDEDASLRLQQLLTDTPLLTAVEDTEWLRLHPLAHEYLRARAERVLSADERRAMHARASQWFERHRMLVPAAHHALEAGQASDALSLMFQALEKGISEAVMKGHLYRGIEIIAALAAKGAGSDPRVLYFKCFQLALTNRQTEAIPGLETLASGADPVLKREGTGILTAALISLDRFDAAVSASSAYAGQASDDSRAARFAHVARAFAACHRGDAEEVLRLLESLPDDGLYVGAQIATDVAAGATFLWDGKPRECERALRRRFVRREALWRAAPWVSMTAAMLAGACWECDERDEARSLLVNRLPDLETYWALPDALCAAYQTLARMFSLDGDDDRALALLKQLDSISSKRQLPRARVVSVMEQIRIHAARGRGRQCATLLEELDALLATSAFEPLLQPLVELHRAMARTYAAFGVGDVEAASRHLDSARALAQRLRRTRETIQVLALRSVLAERAGRSIGELLQEALVLAKAGDMVRVFADTLPEVVECIRRWSGPGAASRSAEDRDFVDRVLRAASVTHQDAKKSVAPSANAMLTPKESQVLQLLAGGMPNKRIATSLGLSSETVKWHVKKLFTKLNAASRQHAVDRARMLGLVP